MKKFTAFLLATIMCILCVSMASAASVTWRCTRPVSVTNLDTGKTNTEYIHTLSVTFNYTPNGTTDRFTGGSFNSSSIGRGIACGGTPTVTSANASFVVSNDGKQLTATFSGFNATVIHYARASKTNEDTTPNTYSYSTTTKTYTFTNQSVSATHTK